MLSGPSRMWSLFRVPSNMCEGEETLKFIFREKTGLVGIFISLLWLQEAHATINTWQSGGVQRGFKMWSPSACSDTLVRYYLFRSSCRCKGERRRYFSSAVQNHVSWRDRKEGKNLTDDAILGGWLVIEGYIWAFICSHPADDPTADNHKDIWESFHPDGPHIQLEGT